MLSCRELPEMASHSPLQVVGPRLRSFTVLCVDWIGCQDCIYECRTGLCLRGLCLWALIRYSYKLRLWLQAIALTNQVWGYGPGLCWQYLIDSWENNLANVIACSKPSQVGLTVVGAVLLRVIVSPGLILVSSAPHPPRLYVIAMVSSINKPDLCNASEILKTVA